MTFSQFSKYLSRIEATTSRNEITTILAELFNALDSSEIEAACWLLLGRILPPYEGLEFQFAEKMMQRAVVLAYDISAEDLLQQYKQTGDLAEVISRHSNVDMTLSNMSIARVYQALSEMARENGEGSQERKMSRIVELLKTLDPLSVRYIVRIVLTKLRLGFSDMTVLDALSWAKAGDKSKRSFLEEAYQRKCDIGKLASSYLTHGEEGLASFDVELGIPIQPALCQRLKTASEMIEKMERVFAESKYDGTRVQIHIQNRKVRENGEEWKVRTFTRSLEESSAQFPELLEAVSIFGNHDLILDCEAVGVDTTTGKLLPFQETIQRKRKHDVGLFAATIPLRFFVFDVLFLDGKSVLRTPLSIRKEILRELFINATSTVFQLSAYEVIDDPDRLRTFHKEQLDAGLEGAVVKKYDSIYQPGRRGWSWVKFKEEETSAAKLSDTIDAVVMGYWYGKGKRNTFGVGAFLIGVAHGDEIVTISKVGTGLTDDEWRELKTRCAKIETTDQPNGYTVPKTLVPDVWVQPHIVVEVAGDELTVSPSHTAKVALRFPRLVRFRDDKTVAQITTTEELKSIS